MKYAIVCILGALLFGVVAHAYAADDASVKMPLPTGLSRDTQFIIYYIDQRISALEREMDKRFEQADKRFEQIDKRFEQVDKQFEQVDKRFDQIDKRFEQVDKRFEQVDKRFEEVNKRFEDLITFLWMLTGIFTTLTAVVIGFAYWDRRTIIKQARDEAIERIEREGRLRDLINALREHARHNKELREVLRSFKLL